MSNLVKIPSDTERDKKNKQEADNALIQYSLTSDDYIDQLLPVIKSALKTNSLNSLIERLDVASQEKQDELEVVSFGSVDGITSTVTSIEGIIHYSTDLSQQLQEINMQLNKSGIDLSQKKRTALKYKKLYNKINDTIFVFNACLDMLNKTKQVLDLIQNQDFYKALMNANSLMKTHIDEIENFEFTKNIHKSIPTLRSMILEEARDQIIKWINLSIEKQLTTVGETLFRNMELNNEDWEKQCDNDDLLLKFKINSPIEKSLRSNDIKYFDPLYNEDVEIDLSPMFHTILVYKAVDDLEKLKDEFNKEVLRKRDRLLYPITEALANNTSNVFKSNEALRIFLFQVSGFFIVDRIVSIKCNYEIREKNSPDDLFASVLKNILPIIKIHIDNHATTPEKIDELNDILGMFLQILQSYEYNIESLYDLLILLFEKFINLKVEEFAITYEDFSAIDDPQATLVNDEKTYNIYLDACFYNYRANENDPFPKTFPYSGIYPATCLTLKKYILSLYTFLRKYYSLKCPTLLNMISCSIDKVLNDIILKDLKEKINSTYKEEVSQNLINLQFFSNSVIEIENFVNFSSDKVISSFPSNSIIKLKAGEYFKLARTQAEDNMFSMVDTKVDGLMEMAEWDWNTKLLNKEPSFFIKDIGQFLETMFFSTFSNIPYSIKTLLLIRTFDLLASRFKNALNEAQFMTVSSVKNFSLDVQYMESIISKLDGDANSNNNSDLQDQDDSVKDSSATLQRMFDSLKQLISLLLEGDLENYKDETIRMRKYNSIKPEEALELLRKLDIYQQAHPTSGLNSPTEDDMANDGQSSLFNLKRSNTTTGDAGSTLSRFAYKFRKDREVSS
ncbi:hypothetical protein B5S28_g4515 [[Candida] boidinii]|nr:hypothetical protein B5S28_g4515 [[Candida] boidinii]OWB59878.1 hypothetical protein B5S29_g743 [[Candida] boidinii]OWB70946.1 hypothetical protein B5S31_g627 [[Candida] boidinii]OWB80498.1 hypothetical protein B5S32_g4781 [[Candida] boidinii]GME90295.1 unnamed protein product [[Candida] boidinii]